MYFFYLYFYIFLQFSIFFNSEIVIRQSYLFCVISCKETRPSSKTVPETMVPVEPYFASKSAKHYVKLTSFSADLSQVRTFPLHTGCKINAFEGTESEVTIRPLVQQLLQKNERRALNSPPPQHRVYQQIQRSSHGSVWITSEAGRIGATLADKQ